MVSLMIEGNAGEGKTVCAVFIATFCPKVKLYSNVHFKQRKYEVFQPQTLLSNETDENRIIIIDEAQRYLNAREGHSLFNKIMSAGNEQRRKTLTIIILTFPMHFMVDKNFRSTCNFIYEAQYTGIKDLYTYKIFSKKYEQYVSEFNIYPAMAQYIYKQFDSRQLIKNYMTDYNVKVADMLQNFEQYHLACVKQVVAFCTERKEKRVTHDICKYIIDSSQVYLDVNGFERKVWIQARFQYDEYLKANKEVVTDGKKKTQLQ